MFKVYKQQQYFIKIKGEIDGKINITALFKGRKKYTQ